jgi:hypothetical protein
MNEKKIDFYNILKKKVIVETTKCNFVMEKTIWLKKN